MGEPLPHPDLDHLAEPRLRDDEREQAGDDDDKDEELVKKDRDVSLLQRMVEVALPNVEPDLPNQGCADDDDDFGYQQRELTAMRRRLECTQQRHKLVQDARAGRLVLAGRCLRQRARVGSVHGVALIGHGQGISNPRPAASGPPIGPSSRKHSELMNPAGRHDCRPQLHIVPVRL